MSVTPQSLIRKLESMPAQMLSEVEDFVDFLASRNQDRSLVRASQMTSTPSLARVWDNADDADYDQL